MKFLLLQLLPTKTALQFDTEFFNWKKNFFNCVFVIQFTIRYAESYFPLMNRLFCRFGFLNSFSSQRWFPEKNISFFPSVSLLTVQKRQMWCQTLKYDVFGKFVLKLSSAPTFYHCPNQLHFTCRVGSGWWRIDILHWLATWTFKTCKLCKSCLWRAYV